MYSMLAMVLFGIGEVVGGFFIGFFIDKFSSRFAVLINITIIIAMGTVTTIFIDQWHFNATAFVMCFLWGFQDSAVHTHTFEILGFEFNDNYTPFSIFGILESIACSICEIIIATLNGKHHYWIYSLVQTIVAIMICGVTYWFPFKKGKVHVVV